MLLPQERVKLLYGPYRTPTCRLGRFLSCRIRGKVKVTGIADSPIPWPTAPRHAKDARPSVIVCGDLVRALRQESATAIAYHWGVSACTVSHWRRQLGVPMFTAGTRQLYGRWLPEKLNEEALRKLKASAQSPQRNAKISAALRGRPMPPKVRKILLKANKGRKHSANSRRHMSEAQKRRPFREGEWLPHEKALLGKMRDREVAQRTGRTIAAVLSKRRTLGIANYAKRKPPTPAPRWTAAKDKLLGTMPDSALARKLGCSVISVRYRRRILNISAFQQGNDKARKNAQ